MSPLAEIPHTRQIPDEPSRRWFWSNVLDLIVWVNEAGSPIGFQLAYDKVANERALTWTADRGFSHMAVDDGEANVGFRHKATPILVADGYFDATRVLKEFRALSVSMPAQIAEFVAQKLKEHPCYSREELAG